MLRCVEYSQPKTLHHFGGMDTSKIKGNSQESQEDRTRQVLARCGSRILVLMSIQCLLDSAIEGPVVFFVGACWLTLVFSKLALLDSCIPTYPSFAESYLVIVMPSI